MERADWGLPWRTHFHLPLQAEKLLDSEAVGTTRGDMLRAYRFALKHDLCRHFEVETYTWSVLPEQERPANDEAMAREIAFVVDLTSPGVRHGHGHPAYGCEKRRRWEAEGRGEVGFTSALMRVESGRCWRRPEEAGWHA